MVSSFRNRLRSVVFVLLLISMVGNGAWSALANEPVPMPSGSPEVLVPESGETQEVEGESPAESSESADETSESGDTGNVESGTPDSDDTGDPEDTTVESDNPGADEDEALPNAAPDSEEITVTPSGIETEDADVEPASLGDGFEPQVAAPGTIVYMTNFTPIFADGDNGNWWFRVNGTRDDPSVNTINVEFANGNIVTAPLTGSGLFKSAEIGSNLDSSLVSVWVYSEQSTSAAVIRLTRGPNNAPPDNALHSVFLNVTSADGITPTTGTTWSLVDSLGTQFDSGTVDATGIVIIQNVPATGYTFSISDPAGMFLNEQISFSVVNADVTREIELDLAPASGWLEFQVAERFGGPRIADAQIILHGPNGDLIGIENTDINGQYRFLDLSPGLYTWEISAPGYTTQIGETDLRTDSHGQGVALDPVSSRTLQGFVVDRDTSEGIENATITVLDAGTIGSTDVAGHYLLENVPGGYWQVTFSSPGYRPMTITAALTVDVLTLNAVLVPADTVPITLDITTTDSGNPEGSTFVVSQSGSTVFSGTLDENGHAIVGELPVGDSYDVLIDGTSAGYLNASDSFTVTRGIGSWELEMSPRPTERITLEAATSDAESPAGATYVVMQGDTEAFSGTFDDSGQVVLGALFIGDSFDVTIDGEPAGYLGTSRSFTVTGGQGTWSLTLQPVDQPITHQYVTLQVITSDGGSPAGATYAVMQGDTEAFSGTFDDSGQVILGALIIGDSFDVTIDGEPAGYLGISRSFTVAAGGGEWEVELSPVPTESITLVVTTTDGGSLAGALFEITEANINTGFATFAITATPITGTLPAEGTVAIGNLEIGTSYLVTINGQPAGYQNASGTFVVEEGEPNWALTLQPLVPGQTPTPDPTPAPSATPTATATASATSTATSTATNEVGTATTTPDSDITGLPSTGSGNDTFGGVIAALASGIMLLMVIGLGIRRIRTN